MIVIWRLLVCKFAATASRWVRWGGSGWAEEASWEEMRRATPRIARGCRFGFWYVWNPVNDILRL